MSEYTPPYTITEGMLELVSAISEKVGRIAVLRGQEAKPHLRKNSRIRSIHSSLKIEANSLSLDEVRDVIDGHSVAGDRREIQEVKNAYKAYGLISGIDPTSISELKRLHGIMTHLTVEDAGSFRTGAEGVFSDGRCIFVCPPPQMVDGLMTRLMSWLKQSEGRVHPLIAAAVFHYEFVFIHPFSDGNGRMARLWHTVILYRWRSIFEYVPLESSIERSQQEYYEAVAACRRNGSLNVFIEFMLKMTDRILDEALLTDGAQSPGASKYVKRMLEAMGAGVPYTSNEIMLLLGLRSKETLRRNYLDPAIKLGLIKMTVPDKPKSRNQRYVRL